MTVVGHAERPERLLTRGGARAGDVLVVTGELGAAGAGLLALEGKAAVDSMPTATRAALEGRQLDPSPRLDAGRALARSGASAMIDVSDGLGGDAAHVAAQSRVGLRIDAGELPIADGVAAVAAAAGCDPLELAIGGGEDYELLATVPAAALGSAAEAVRATGTALTAIGEVGGGGASGDAVEIRRPGGEPLRIPGFDQLG